MTSESPFFVGTVDPDARHNRLRYQATLSFLGPLKGRVLDCGDPNFLKGILEKENRLTIESTNGDLDDLELAGTYDIVLAFELIEHLMNPLHFLQQVRKVLAREGRFFLTTPINKPKFLWRDDHFHEFDEYRLGMLVEKAGFVVVRKEIRRFYRITGIRPIIRRLSRSGTIFLELRPRTGE